MKAFLEKNKKLIFWLILLINLAIIAGMNHFTPLFSDDITYTMFCEGASSPLDVIKLDVAEYIGHNCRFIAQFFLFSYLSIGAKIIPNVVGSFAFIALGLLIYANIRGKKKYDCGLILLIFALMWLFLAAFGQSVLWLSGAVAYLYGAVWILGFVTFYKHILNKNQIKHPILLAVFMFIFGVAAGICNENTSGGAFLLIFIYTLNKILTNKEKNIPVKNSFRAYMFTGHIGVLTGLALMVLGPGAWNRGKLLQDSNFSGFLGILSRAYKITVSIADMLLPLLVMIIISLVILAVQHKFRSFKDVRENGGVIFLVVGIITCYVLVAVEPTSARIFFGPSVYLIVSLCQMITDIDYKEDIFKVIKYSLITILVVMTLYDTMLGTINLFRINREESERVEIIKSVAETGADWVTVPQLTPEFNTRFSALYDNDLNEDPDYWINVYYEYYLGVPRIIAIPRDEWNEENYGE